ncbi:MAG: ABZJ_00895 family protein [Alphaproteobacteria bacterium]
MIGRASVVTSVLVFFVISLGLGLVVTAFPYLTGIDLGSGAHIGTTIGAAFVAGTTFASRTKRLPTLSERFGFSIAATVVSFVLSLASLVAALLIAERMEPDSGINPARFWAMMGDIDPGLITGVVIVTALLVFATIFFPFRWGAGTQVKAIARKEAKLAAQQA